MKKSFKSHSIPLFINKDSQILILGSFPSVKSLEKGFYYAHKSNRFYKVLSKVFDDELFLSTNINDKKEALKKYKLALYDVIEECEIHLSDDNSICNERPINLKSILENFPITLIAINGNTAKKLYLKYFSFINIKVIYLPSTSSRNATYNEEKLVNKYLILKDNI